MGAEEALRIILLYAMNESSCGKLPEQELKASKILKEFIRDLKTATREELESIINERL